MEGKRDRNKHRSRVLPSAGSLPKYPQQTGMSQTEARNERPQKAEVPALRPRSGALPDALARNIPRIPPGALIVVASVPSNYLVLYSTYPLRKIPQTKVRLNTTAQKPKNKIMAESKVIAETLFDST